MNRLRIYGITACVLLVSFLLASWVSISFLKKIVDQNEQEMTYNLTSQFYNDITETLTAPIMVSRTMSHNLYLQNLISEKDFPRNKKEESDVIEYLRMICEGLNYNTCFIVSNVNGRYYTNKGFNKIVKPGEDPHDIWYSNFIENGHYYDFDVDTDETNKNTWTVFVNCRMEDNDKNLLGVCGIGVEMSFLQERLQQYEANYGVKINLVDKNGLVQIDTDSINIEAAVLNEAIADFNEDENYTYRRAENGGFIVTKYVNQFGWYLVVTKESHDNTLYYRMLGRLLLSFILIFVIITLILLIIMRKERRSLEHKARYDALSGVLNKQTFLYYLNDRRKSETKNTFAFLFIDLDNFKHVNDILGHTTGDEAIKATADILKSYFRQGDLLGRFGGDEFVIYMKNFPEPDLINRVEKILKKLDTSYENNNQTVKTSASIGIVFSENGSDISGSELLDLADKELYKAKAAGRNQYKMLKL